MVPVVAAVMIREVVSNWVTDKYFEKTSLNLITFRYRQSLLLLQNMSD